MGDIVDMQAINPNLLCFTGLSGVGDAMLTCYGPLSRNRAVGVRLGKGETLQEILASSSEVGGVGALRVHE